MDGDIDGGVHHIASLLRLVALEGGAGALQQKLKFVVDVLLDEDAGSVQRQLRTEERDFFGVSAGEPLFLASIADAKFGWPDDTKEGVGSSCGPETGRLLFFAKEEHPYCGGNYLSDFRTMDGDGVDGGDWDDWTDLPLTTAATALSCMPNRANWRYLVRSFLYSHAQTPSQTWHPDRRPRGLASHPGRTPLSLPIVVQILVKALRGATGARVAPSAAGEETGLTDSQSARALLAVVGVAQPRWRGESFKVFPKMSARLAGGGGGPLGADEIRDHWLQANVKLHNGIKPEWQKQKSTGECLPKYPGPDFLLFFKVWQNIGKEIWGENGGPLWTRATSGRGRGGGSSSSLARRRITLFRAVLRWLWPQNFLYAKPIFTDLVAAADGAGDALAKRELRNWLESHVLSILRTRESSRALKLLTKAAHWFFLIPTIHDRLWPTTPLQKNLVKLRAVLRAAVGGTTGVGQNNGRFVWDATYAMGGGLESGVYGSSVLGLGFRVERRLQFLEEVRREGRACCQGGPA